MKWLEAHCVLLTKRPLLYLISRSKNRIPQTFQFDYSLYTQYPAIPTYPFLDKIFHFKQRGMPCSLSPSLPLLFVSLDSLKKQIKKLSLGLKIEFGLKSEVGIDSYQRFLRTFTCFKGFFAQSGETLRIKFSLDKFCITHFDLNSRKSSYPIRSNINSIY